MSAILWENCVECLQDYQSPLIEQATVVANYAKCQGTGSSSLYIPSTGSSSSCVSVINRMEYEYCIKHNKLSPLLIYNMDDGISVEGNIDGNYLDRRFFLVEFSVVRGTQTV